MTGRAFALILAAGTGERLGFGTPKAFLDLAGRPLVVRAAERALASASIGSIVVAVPPGTESRARVLLEGVGPSAVVAGGASRHASVRIGLAAVPPDVAVIVCHDAARPFASPRLFDAVVAGLTDVDGVVPVVDVPDTVKRIREGIVVGTEPRGELGLAQTPQAFAATALRDAHARAEAAGREFTDDAAVLEWAGYRVRAIPGDPDNFKVTTAEDLARGEAAIG